MNFKHLLNPFERIAGSHSLFIGLAAMLLAGIIGYFSKTHFDGILNIHSGMQGTWQIHVLQPVISVATVAIWFWLFAKIFGKPTVRTIDIVGTQCFAFIPLVPASTLGFFEIIQVMNLKLQQYAAQPGGPLDIDPLQMTAFVSLMLITMVLTVWSAIWIYKGFKIAANLPDHIHIPAYVSGLIVGMIVPKLIVSLIN